MTSLPDAAFGWLPLGPAAFCTILPVLSRQLFKWSLRSGVAMPISARAGGGYAHGALSPLWTCTLIIYCSFVALAFCAILVSAQCRCSTDLSCGSDTELARATHRGCVLGPSNGCVWGPWLTTKSATEATQRHCHVNHLALATLVASSANGVSYRPPGAAPQAAWPALVTQWWHMVLECPTAGGYAWYTSGLLRANSRTAFQDLSLRSSQPGGAARHMTWHRQQSVSKQELTNYYHEGSGAHKCVAESQGTAVAACTQPIWPAGTPGPGREVGGPSAVGTCCQPRKAHSISQACTVSGEDDEVRLQP